LLRRDFDDDADQLVVDEVMRLVARDSGQADQVLIEFHEEMRVAESMIAEEIGPRDIDFEDFGKQWEAAHDNLGDERIDDRIARQKRKVGRLTTKLGKRNESGVATTALLTGKFNTVEDEVQRLDRECEMYERWHQLETQTLAARIDALRAVNEEKEKLRSELDHQYRALIDEEQKRNRALKRKSGKG
jgi:uncharacterized protein with PIN domain